MSDSSSVDAILEFLKKNKFAKAEAALRSELGSRPDLNGILQKLILFDKESGITLNQEVNGGIVVEEDPKKRNATRGGGSVKDASTSRSTNASKELVVKEVEYGSGRNGLETSSSTSGDQNTVTVNVGASDKKFALSKGIDDAVLELFPWKHGVSNGPDTSHQKEYGSTVGNNFLGFQNANMNSAPTLDSVNPELKNREDVIPSGGKSLSWSVNAKPDTSEVKELNQQRKLSSLFTKDEILNNPCSRSDASTLPSIELMKECPVKTVFPFSNGDTSTSYDNTVAAVDKNEGKRGADRNDVRTAIKEQVDGIGRALLLEKTQSLPKNIDDLELHFAMENPNEQLPRLPPVRLKSEDKPFNLHSDEKSERDRPGPKVLNADNSYHLGSFLDVPLGQELNLPGKRLGGGNWMSISQGIAEDTTSDLVSGFASIGDGLSESFDFPNEYWDSDEYEDDDDVGYMRQPIEDETWFLAHEIDYPSDTEKGTGPGSVPDHPERGHSKNDEDDQSFGEDDSYFSRDPYLQSKNVDAVIHSDDHAGLSATEIHQRNSENGLVEQYDGHLMDEEELNLMRAEPAWQGLVSQTNELLMTRDGSSMNENAVLRFDDACVDDDQLGSVRSIGVGINSDTAEIGSEVRESFIGGSSDGDIEYVRDHDLKNTCGQSKKGNDRMKKHHSGNHERSSDKGEYLLAKNCQDGGFSFPPPRDGKLVQTSADISLWSNQGTAFVNDEAENCRMNSEDALASWKHRSNDSSPVNSSKNESNINGGESANSSPSSLQNGERLKNEEEEEEYEEVKTTSTREEDPEALLEDEEAIAVQEQVKQIKAQEEEFETFSLKIVHRKNRTGFEEDKSFQVVLNSVIAGRYHVTEYLGSAAFSKAIQAHDLHTGMDVCVKIIKNNKDFFDQSLDEIKLLKYVNRYDPGDKFHLLRLYDYFYYREHLLIVCELLKANLYEFQKFNKESGGEVYFTMPRLQSITIQCLEALQFLHSLGLIHCDLKPENILVKSYSRCEVKVIDLGSSCFETDNLCSYVQSRSYRAPEVILGLPYDKKIDIWSLGCILAELCSGYVLFQNDSPATLLARVVGIIGHIPQEMLAKGRDTYKIFTKNHMLYEKNQDTGRLEYLIPKKSSLKHRLPMGDQGFIDFVTYLLEANPTKRPSAAEALKHPWLQYPYEPISS